MQISSLRHSKTYTAQSCCRILDNFSSYIMLDGQWCDFYDVNMFQVSWAKTIPIGKHSVGSAYLRTYSRYNDHTGQRRWLRTRRRCASTRHEYIPSTASTGEHTLGKLKDISTVPTHYIWIFLKKSIPMWYQIHQEKSL